MYAATGATSLLIDAPGFGSRKGPRIPTKNAPAAFAFCEQLVGDLQRALEYLSAQPGVDTGRLAFVGHSLGASIGGAFLKTVPEMKAAALMAGTGMLSHVWLTSAVADAAQLVEPFDGIRCLPQVRTSLLLQFAKHDEFISKTDADAQIAAAPDPRAVDWQDCDHAFDANALQTRYNWLSDQLDLDDNVSFKGNQTLPNSQIWRYKIAKFILRVTNRSSASK